MSAILAAATPAAPAASSWPTLFRLSVAQYEAMAEHGILNENDRVELLRGLLMEKETILPPHAITVDLVHDALRAMVEFAGWHVRTQAALKLADSVPEPDDSVTRGKRRDYGGRHPVAADTGLVIEVSDSTLNNDRTTKKELYAEAKIPTYWIVNLVDNQLEVYTDPVGSDYASKAILAPADEVAVVLDGTEVGRVRVADLLP